MDQCCTERSPAQTFFLASPPDSVLILVNIYLIYAGLMIIVLVLPSGPRRGFISTTALRCSDDSDWPVHSVVFLCDDLLPQLLVVWFSAAYPVDRHGRTTIACLYLYMHTKQASCLFWLFPFPALETSRTFWNRWSSCGRTHSPTAAHTPAQ